MQKEQTEKSKILFLLIILEKNANETNNKFAINGKTKTKAVLGKTSHKEKI